MGNPIFGRASAQRVAERMNQIAMEGTEGPQEVLGVIPDQPMLDPTPQGPSTTWTGPSGTIALDEGPPPWELEGKEFDDSDARRYVDVPSSWTLYWMNPRLLEQQGWRHYRPVTTGDPRVKVKVLQMATPDGNIRRGGHTGDILAYMPTHWVDSLKAKTRAETAKKTQSAVDKFESLKDEFRRNGLTLDSARHPTHTQVDGRSIRD